jgi:feruloyl-CoA synthase
MTGTWVTAGTLRTRLISAAGVLSDAVICGQDSEYVAALAWVNQPEARKLCDADADADAGADAGADVALDDPHLRARIATALAELGAGAGSAGRIERLLLLAEPPSLDFGEITDKGYLNQRACRERRADDIARLYAAEPAGDVITPAGD